MTLARVNSIQLPTNTKKFCHESDDSPHEYAYTQDGSEVSIPNIVLTPLSLSFHDKEKVYALVQWKLKLLTSTSDPMNFSKSGNNFKLSKRIQENVVMTMILSYAGTR